MSRNSLHVICHDLESMPFVMESLQFSGSVVSPMITDSDGLCYIRYGQNGSPGQGSLVLIGRYAPAKTDRDVRRYFRHMGYDGPTLGSVGEKLLAAVTPGHEKLWVPGPEMNKMIARWSYGSRVHCHPGRFKIREAWEYDYRAAYLSNCRQTPGTVPPPRYVRDSRAISDALEEESPALLRAQVQAASHSGSPLPCLTGERTVFPDRGWWKGWWWNEELHEALRVGWKIQPDRAIIWESLTEWMEPWCDLMMQKQGTAPDDIVRSMVKNTRNAVPGRFLMPPEHYRFLTLEESREGDSSRDQVFCTDAYNVVVGRPVVRRNRGSLTHIGSHIRMRGRVNLYNLMTSCRQHGVKVLHANTDNVYLDRPLPDDLRHFIGPRDGQLKEIHHTNVVFDGTAVVSDQVSKLPGSEEGTVGRAKREGELRAWAAG